MWIELHQSARKHPKTIKLAKRLGIPTVHALGHLAALWLWALEMAPDGDLSSFDIDDIEIGAEWDGEPGAFVVAAEALRLLDPSQYGGLAVHDWEDFSGSLKAAKRQKEYRQRKLAREIAERDSDVMSHNGDVTVTQRHGDITLTERTNDQNERTTAPVPLSGIGPVRPEDIDAVREHYRAALPEVATVMLKGDRHIADRLREGRSVAALCKAIDGCDDWHRDKGLVTLRHILGSADKVDDMIAKASASDGEKPKPTQRAGPTEMAGESESDAIYRAEREAPQQQEPK